VIRVYDTFMYGGEADILECRLRELDDSPVDRFVIVEAELTHRGDPKPLYFREDEARFRPWSGRITYIPVEADLLPSRAQNPDPWSREHAQREFAALGLADAALGDIILHGDCDEIPSRNAIGRVLASEELLPLVLQMRLAQYAADWVHPLPWNGTIATRKRSIGTFAGLRALRNSLPALADAGTHLSWMGGTDAHVQKLGLHCHLEMTAATEAALRSGRWLREGLHSDGHKLTPADVDSTWPQWVYHRECPASWWRPREEG
jgi:Glycosyltransferase family 17